MNLEELHDSDSSDEDYVPNKKDDSCSEIDSDDDSEDAIQKKGSTEESPSSSRKRKKNSSKYKKKLKNIDQAEITNSDPDGLTEEDKKQKADDIWADFMKDTGFKSKSECINNPLAKSSPSDNKSSKIMKTEEKKTTITEIFNFAGENVTVEREVTEQIKDKGNQNVSTSKSTKNKGIEPKSHGSGIGGILSQLGKKTKISTLEKSKIDWDRFKKEENLEEELQTFNRGKDGYLEKQDFLNRADLRRFEIERELRTVERNKRVNNL